MRKILASGLMLGVAFATSSLSAQFFKIPSLSKISPTLSATSNVPIHGWADYHGHQMSHLGFGGGFIWGNHTGSIGSCTGKNHGLTWVPGIIGLNIGSHGSKNQINKHWPLWNTVHHQQYFRDWLKSAHDNGMKLFVMSAVNNDLMCEVVPNGHGISPVACDDWSNLVRQIDAAKTFAANNSWYRIAYTPAQARQIIAEGDLAVVLSVEASNTWGNTDNWNDIRSRIDGLYNMGVRAMQPVHEFDNNVSGAAYFKGLFSWAQAIQDTLASTSWLPGGPVGFIATVNKNRMNLDSNNHNLLGLTPNGKLAVQHMIDKKIIIDAAHLSERAFNDTYNISAQNRYYPMHASHAHFRAIFNKKKQDEKKLSAAMVQKIKKTGGTVGLRTGKERTKTYSPAGVANNCQGSSKSWAQMYMLGVVGYDVPMGFGLDMAGMIEQVRPRFRPPTSSQWYEDSNKKLWACGEDDQRGLSATVVNQPEKEKRVHDATPDYERGRQGGRTYTNYDYIGLAHVGYVKDFMTELQNLGVQTNSLWDGAEAYIQMWERQYATRSTSPLPYSTSESGIDHNSLTDPCSGWRAKLGGYGSKPVCKRVPHFNIQRHNCSNTIWKDQFNKEWCIENSGDMYKAREVVADKCPVPYTRHSNWTYSGKIVCKPIPAFKIRSSKCRNQGGFTHNGRCLWNKGYWYNSRPLR